MYKKFYGLQKHHQVFFGIIITAGLILYWRGVWGLADIYMFPQNHILSFITSIVIGVAVLLTAHYTIEQIVE